MSTTGRTEFAGLLFAVAIPFAGAGSAGEADKASPDPGDERRATVVKVGWWWAANEPPPETGILAAPQPPTPTTPTGTVPVGAVGGDPEKVSAIEVRLEAESGSTVKSFEMVLRESTQPGANVNAETARILACPVTELFWADGNAAAWKNRPTYDCELASAKGKRTTDGLWRFDLTAIAAGWLAEGSTDSRSVVLVEDVDPPESFQLALDGPKNEGVGLALRAIAPAGSGTDGLHPGGGSTGSGTSPGSGGDGAWFNPDDSAVDLGGLAPAPVDAGSPPTTSAGEEAGGQPQGALAAAPMAASPEWYSGIPSLALLMAPLTLGVAYLIMLALGPAGRPAPATGRHGVSRALDRLRQTGRDLRSAR